jgi:hypothetical protein
MGLIVIIALVATFGFYKRAEQIGIHPGKAASIPFVGAGWMLAFTYLSSFWIGRFLSATAVSERTVYWLVRAIEWSLMLWYCYYVKRNWDVLCASKISVPEDRRVP